MVTIKSTETGKTVEAELIDPKTQSDMLADIIGMSGIETDEDWNFLVDSDEELGWWVNWAETEPLIWDARDEADEETKAKDDELISAYGSDLGLLQDMECKLFGIER